MSARKLAFGFFGLVTIGMVGMMVFSPAVVMPTAARIGGVQFETWREPLSLGAEFQGALLAEEVLPLHQPALPFGFEFEGTVEQGLVEAESSELLGEILAGETLAGEIIGIEAGSAQLLEPAENLETDAAALTTGAETLAVTQVEKEIMAEHRYLGGCNGY